MMTTHKKLKGKIENQKIGFRYQCTFSISRYQYWIYNVYKLYTYVHYFTNINCTPFSYIRRSLIKIEGDQSSSARRFWRSWKLSGCVKVFEVAINSGTLRASCSAFPLSSCSKKDFEYLGAREDFLVVAFISLLDLPLPCWWWWPRCRCSGSAPSGAVKM